MKACPVCGLDLEDTYLFCPEDGSPLDRSDASALAEDLPEDRIAVASTDESNANAAGPVVLYCPACAAEYPLTFSECPVHGIPLTKHRIPTFVNPPAGVVEQAPEPHIVEERTSGQRQAQSAASYSSVIVRAHVDSIPAGGLVQEPLREPLIVKDRIEDQASGYDTPAEIVEETDRDPKSFRVAAIMIAVGLAVLSVVALYALYSNVTRRPASQAARSGNNSPVSTPESAFIPTPEAALDYKEEPPATSSRATAAAKDDSRDDKEPARAVATATSKEPVQKADVRKSPVSSSQPTIAAPTPVTVKRPASATDIVLPRGTYGLVDARLIRMRARQTPSGYRYDLTFNLQEQAGRVTQYDRLAVVTRSASGVNHSEVMPFFHRLGAAGDLTFTVSVELKGRSEADWQGRIICTSIGTDNQGKPLRTSFGANVSP